MENNFRDVKDDLMKEWFEFLEEYRFCYSTEEDKKHYIKFDEISERILKNVPKQNQKYVKKQLDLLDRNFLDYVCYYNEMYYRNGFCGWYAVDWSMYEFIEKSPIGLFSI